MFLKRSNRIKDGKEHIYWSIVEKQKVGRNKFVQRQVLYLGELTTEQEVSWENAIKKISDEQIAEQLYLPCQERAIKKEELVDIPVKLSQMQLYNAREYGSCWLSLYLWDQLKLDAFWRSRLKKSREGTDWVNILKLQTAYTLISPGSEWRLHTEWYNKNAMKDLLSCDDGVSQKDNLYRCLDKILPYKQDIFEHLKSRWQDLFNASYEILLYDLTNTHFECDAHRYADNPNDKRKFGKNKQKRNDCLQVTIALIVTPEGFPLNYEVLPGNTNETTTLRDFIEKIEKRYGKADRVWIMDRGIPTEATLREMRDPDNKISYLVGTPRSQLKKLEASFLDKSWEKVNTSVKVKLTKKADEVYILTKSAGREKKENSILMRRLKKYWNRLKEIQVMNLSEDQLKEKLIIAKHEAGTAKDFVEVIPLKEIKKQSRNEKKPIKNFTFSLKKEELRERLESDGLYLLRSNLTEEDPKKLWNMYILLTQIEQSFKELKSNLKIRPIFHQKQERVEAHIFVAFLAYCLLVILKNILKRSASGLTPRAVIAKLSTIQMVDVVIPTLDNRMLLFSRYVQPTKDIALILDQAKIRLPQQPPPRICEAEKVLKLAC